MTDYNDGEWHTWDRSERPESVHPKSLIEFLWHDRNVGTSGISAPRPAGGGRDPDGTGPTPAWGHIHAFRVTEVYEPPLEAWVNVYPDGYDPRAYKTEEGARRGASLDVLRVAVHMREVRDE